MIDYTNLKREMKIIRTLLLIFGTGALFAQDSANGFRVQIFALNQK